MDPWDPWEPLKARINEILEANRRSLEGVEEWFRAKSAALWRWFFWFIEEEEPYRPLLVPRKPRRWPRRGYSWLRDLRVAERIPHLERHIPHLPDRARREAAAIVREYRAREEIARLREQAPREYRDPRRYWRHALTIKAREQAFLEDLAGDLELLAVRERVERWREWARRVRLYLRWVRERISELQSLLGSLEGTVTDRLTGRPIAGARLRLLELGLEAATDSSGRYVFRDIPSGEYTLTVEAPGYRPTALRVRVVGRTVQDVALEPLAGSLEGWVRDALTKKPIRGARVTVEFVWAGEARKLEAATDEHGYYRIDGIPPGRWAARCEAPDYLPASDTVEIRPGEVARKDWDLVPAFGSLEGFVRDAKTKEPIKGAVVEVEVIAEGKVRLLRELTDKDGHYRIDGIPPGKWKATVRAPGYAPASQDVEIRPGEVTRKDWELYKAPTRIIQGRMYYRTYFRRYTPDPFAFVAVIAKTFEPDRPELREEEMLRAVEEVEDAIAISLTLGGRVRREEYERLLEMGWTDAHFRAQGIITHIVDGRDERTIPMGEVEEEAEVLVREWAKRGIRRTVEEAVGELMATPWYYVVFYREERGRTKVYREYFGRIMLKDGRWVAEKPLFITSEPPELSFKEIVSSWRETVEKE
jgi:protocatechuate 3,4-dioxygenase beta subunit